MCLRPWLIEFDLDSISHRFPSDQRFGLLHKSFLHRVELLLIVPFLLFIVTASETGETTATSYISFG
jgi:hypothetical protein